MNSRSGNESNLVNFSADISSLNQLETKDGLLSFPFDHIYACNSEGSERRQTIQLAKEVEITTHCVVAEEDPVPGTSTDVARLTERLTSAENQNKRLKQLLIYHLDLIQQQNDVLTKREKSFQALKQENETLKSRLNRMDRRVTLNQRHSTNPPPLVQVASSTITQPKTEPGTAQIMLNSFTELLIPDSRPNSIIFEGELAKPKTFVQNNFEIKNPEPDVSTFIPTELGVFSILDSKDINCQEYAMIDNKTTFIKKEMKSDTPQEAIYTVATGNSANPVIQRIQRSRRKGTGSLSRMSKTIKIEPPETPNTYGEDKYDRNYTVNKKSKMINTYGKSSRNLTQKKTLQFTGSLSDRLQLIDTTPTGEDPYQLGEAEMREQSPIPKLMLQKTNQGRMKICSSNKDTATKRHFYESPAPEVVPEKPAKKIKLNSYNLTNTYVHPSEIKKEETVTSDSKEPDLDIVKTEPEIDWQIYSNTNQGNETSLCDFSYGESANNLAQHSILQPLDSVEFQDLFHSDVFQPDAAQTTVTTASTTTTTTTTTVVVKTEKTSKRAGRTTSLVVANSAADTMLKPNDKRGRKRALSTTGLLKNIKKEPNTVMPKPITKGKAPARGKASCRGKKTPLPGVETRRPYHTLVGDPDVSWYLGLDPEVKPEDVYGSGGAEATVEVPRWREKPITGSNSGEGTENLDDAVFEKRHQKLEAEERRQLRWHMRRVREQRHVERLRMRQQRDTWSSAAAAQQPSSFTVWPQPVRDVKFLEITDTLPVTAFGEALPAVPEGDFVLPWIRSHKACKRSKRSKTLH